MILGGLDEFTGSYETLTGWLGIVPAGTGRRARGDRRGADAVGDLLQHRAGGGLPARARQLAGRSTPTPRAGAARRRRPRSERAAGRFDPRAVVLAALLASALLLASTSWPLLLGVTAWLIPAWLLSRPDNDAVPLGLVLAGAARVRRAHRRAAERRRAGADAARVAARRAARRRRDVDARRGRRAAGCARRSAARCTGSARIPSVREGAALMEGLDAGPRLIAARPRRRGPLRRRRAQARRAVRHGHRLGGAPSRRPTGRAPAAPPRALRLRAPDGVLVALTLAPALALLGA